MQPLMPSKRMQVEYQQFELLGYPIQGAPAELRLQSPHSLWTTQQRNPRAVLTFSPHSGNPRAV